MECHGGGGEQVEVGAGCFHEVVVVRGQEDPVVLVLVDVVVIGGGGNGRVGFVGCLSIRGANPGENEHGS